MKKFFQEIVKAINDFKFYKQIKDFEMAKGMKYIFLLVLLMSLLLTIRYIYDLGRGLDIAIDWARQNLPVIEIQNGVVSADVRQPYKIIEEDFALIIDTTGEVTSLDEYQRGILLMKNRVIYKESDVKTETYDLLNIQTLRIDENFMKALRKNAVWIISPFMLIFLYIRFCLAKFFHIFIFSAISLITSSIVDIKLSYKQLFNIGIYAITPSVALGTILGILGIQPPFFGIIYSGLYIIYLIIAVLNCKEKPTAASAQGEASS